MTDAPLPFRFETLRTELEAATDPARLEMPPLRVHAFAFGRE